MKCHTLIFDCPNKNKFCGLPKGIKSEPLMAAMFSMEITGKMYFSLSPFLNKRIVKGTKIISDTSFVTNIDVKKTPKIKNSESVAIVLNFLLKLITGSKIFSCLKPSRTHNIIKRVPSVCQSISLISAFVGGVINKETTAASTATVSIISFFKNSNTFFIYPKSF